MKDYLRRFENEVMQSLIGCQRKNIYQLNRPVPIQGGKLINSDFATFIGDTFDYDGLLAFNYYGFYKVSSGIRLSHAETVLRFPGIKTITSPVINFASILPVDVQGISEGLFLNFSDFKDMIVKLRWGTPGS